MPVVTKFVRIAPLKLPPDLLAGLERWAREETAAHPEDPMSRARLVRTILADALRRHEAAAASVAAPRKPKPSR